ncbi:MAG TPA: hypothetical protein VMB73_15685 [Acetobacteraceae bacterium]|nr:hypothetical protein [Acetobacteraceae bacterium]
MDVDVRKLLEMHLRLAPTSAADLAHKAAVGLARHGHRGSLMANRCHSRIDSRCAVS